MVRLKCEHGEAMKPLMRYETGHFLASQVIRAARSVHECLGPGYEADYYRRAITNELQRRKLEVQRLFPVDVWQGGELAELFFLDLFVEWQVIVEIKASRRPFSDSERDQVIDYLEAAGAPVGLLFNFGRGDLVFEPFFL